MKIPGQISTAINRLTPRRRNYLILRLDSFISDGAAIYDPKVLTIEHVLPQTVDEESEWAEWWPDDEVRQLWVHRLANLVPLNKKRNSAAQNYEFAKKMRCLFLWHKERLLIRAYQPSYLTREMDTHDHQGPSKDAYWCFDGELGT